MNPSLSGLSKVMFAAGRAFFQLKKDWHAETDKLQGAPLTTFGN